MSEALTMLLAGLAGGALGAIFFGGLWWTVRKGLTSKQPAFWFLGSLLLRMGIVLAGFYFVANLGLGRLMVCLLGFVLARLVVTQATRTAGEPLPSQEARHAP
jgi:F1F0 ATPase subunit 2